MASEDTLITVFEYTLDVAEEIQTALGRRLPVLDLGGGFVAPYATRGNLPMFTTLKSRLETLFDRRLPGWRTGQQRVVFESGRYLTATCGTLLARVLDVKTSQGQRILVLDSGVHHLGGLSGLGKEHRVEPDLVTERDPGELNEYFVAGPLCHPLDSWSGSAKLPGIRRGDMVAVPNVGAYGLHSSLALFHGHPLPVEVVVDGRTELERTRMSVRREPLE
jgi:diaminopimelate decarboxylase